MSIVGAVVRNGDYKRAVERVLSPFLANLDLARGVFLKPNIVFPVRPESRQITHPRIVAALVDVLRGVKRDVEIVIGEGTAAGTNPEENFRISGYEELARKLRVSLLDLNGCPRIPVPWMGQELALPALAFERVYINLPILKRSSAALMSAAMKNQKGLLSPEMKKRFHRLDLHRPIAELALSVRPDLTILDTSRFFKKAAVLAGDNTFEMDHFLCRSLGIPFPGYVEVAERIGAGAVSYEVSLDGDLASRRLKWDQEEYKRFLRMRIWSNPRACSMCRLGFQEMKDFRKQRAGRTVMVLAKLLKNGIFGTDVLFGSDPHYRGTRKRVVCIGNCTKKLAEDEGYEHVPGCPPRMEEIIRKL